MLVNAIGSAILHSAVKCLAQDYERDSRAAMRSCTKLLARIDSSHFKDAINNGLTYQAQTFEAMEKA